MESTTDDATARATRTAAADADRRAIIRSAPAPQRFVALLAQSLAQGRFVRLVLARYHGTEAGLLRLSARRLLLRGQDRLSLLYRYQTRDVTRNLPVPEGIDALAAMLGPSFRNAHLLTTTEEVHLALSRRGQATLRRHAKAGAQAGEAAAANPAAADAPAANRQVADMQAAEARAAAARASDVHAAGVHAADIHAADIHAVDVHAVDADAVDADAACATPAAGAANGAAAQPCAHAGTPHDREKRRWVAIDRPYLVALGVTDAQHRLVPAMARKWKQINKFVEVFSQALASSTLASMLPAQAAAPSTAPPGPQRDPAGAQPSSAETRQRVLRVLDFGSGKGYLTFAVHDHLRHALGLQAQVTGVELRAELAALCNGVAAQLALPGLAFEPGDIATRTPQPVDVMIALHACDTATDHAIHHGIVAGAAVILCSPCCHRQLRPQLLGPHPIRPILQHGIHRSQQAEMLTDGLRALLLESRGYRTQVFEFVALEHTQKNKMILAVKRDRPGPPHEVLAQIDEIKRFYGIREQCLETLLTAAR